MKTLIRILTSIILAVTLLATPALTGCVAPTSVKAKAFLTLQDTWSAKDRAMKVYADLAVRGKLTIEQRQKVWMAHDKFQRSFDAALGLVGQDWTAPTPQIVEVSATELVSLVNSLK